MLEVKESRKRISVKAEEIELEITEHQREQDKNDSRWIGMLSTFEKLR